MKNRKITFEGLHESKDGVKYAGFYVDGVFHAAHTDYQILLQRYYFDWNGARYFIFPEEKRLIKSKILNTLYVPEKISRKSAATSK